MQFQFGVEIYRRPDRVLTPTLYIFISFFTLTLKELLPNWFLQSVSSNTTSKSDIHIYLFMQLGTETGLTDCPGISEQINHCLLKPTKSVSKYVSWEKFWSIQTPFKGVTGAKHFSLSLWGNSAYFIQTLENNSTGAI